MTSSSETSSYLMQPVIYLKDLFQYLFPRPVVRLFVLYFIWISMHYLASHLYTMVCTPWSVKGFILSPLLIPAPHCEALRWVIYHGALRIHTMWILLGGYVINVFEQKIIS